MLETYNKEKLHEYAKELFALCLEKGLGFVYINLVETIEVHFNNGVIYKTYIIDELYIFKSVTYVPIWELIEKVKQL